MIDLLENFKFDAGRLLDAVRERISNEGFACLVVDADEVALELLEPNELEIHRLVTTNQIQLLTALQSYPTVKIFDVNMNRSHPDLNNWSRNPVENMGTDEHTRREIKAVMGQSPTRIIKIDYSAFEGLPRLEPLLQGVKNLIVLGNHAASCIHVAIQSALQKGFIVHSTPLIIRGYHEKNAREAINLLRNENRGKFYLWASL